MCNYPQETILNFYKSKHEKFRRFGGANKHFFRKMDLITKALSLLYIWHNSDSFLKAVMSRLYREHRDASEDFVKGVPNRFC